LLGVRLWRIWLLGVGILLVRLRGLTGDVVTAVGAELGAGGHRGVALRAQTRPVIQLHRR
jgi:hypothetical protein